MTPAQMYDFIMLALCIWRESRGEPLNVKQAVAWSIRNRVLNPGWWGHGWSGVILQPYQYSSFNRTDPNATKLPIDVDPSWQDSLLVATQVHTIDPATAPVIPDPTNGAVNYYDSSMASAPPAWALDGSFVKVLVSGRLTFWRRA